MTILWNKVTWYSKVFALVLFIALPFIGFYYGSLYGAMVGATNQKLLLVASQQGGEVTAQNQDNVLPAYYTTPSEWQVDANNTAGGFSIAHPIDFDTQGDYTPVNQPAAPAWRNNVSEPGTTYFVLTVPKSFEPQTNLDEARLTVGASGNSTAVAQCMEQINVEPTMATSSEMINGVPFTVFYSSDAGAGNLYEIVSYRTLHAGKCYAVEYVIHSSQLMNYPAEYHLKQFDETKIATLMQGIIGTFKFL